jgi:hypothetical protein
MIIQDGKTLLQLAVTNSFFYIVRYLIERCLVDVDQLSVPEKQTALHIACIKNQTDIASYLISVNASLNICDKAGKMPYDLCSSIDLKRLINQAIAKNHLNDGFMEDADLENGRLLKQAKDNDNGIFQNRENGSSSSISHQVNQQNYLTTQDTKYADSTDDNMNNSDNIKRLEVGIPFIDTSNGTHTGASLTSPLKRIEPPIMNVTDNECSPIDNRSSSFDLDDFDEENVVSTNVENHQEIIENINMNDFEDEDD